MAKNKKQNMEQNNTNEQENTNMENNTNEQEQNMENNTNEQENNGKISTLDIETAINAVIEKRYQYELNDSTMYVTLQENIKQINSAVETASGVVLEALNNEKNRIQSMMLDFTQELKRDVTKRIINAICEKYNVRGMAKKSSNGNTQKTTNSDKYSYLDAILDNITEEWISPNELAKRIQTAGRLEQANSNPRFAGALANTLTTAVKSGQLDYDSTTHKYRLHIETVENAAG